MVTSGNGGNHKLTCSNNLLLTGELYLDPEGTQLASGYLYTTNGLSYNFVEGNTYYLKITNVGSNDVDGYLISNQLIQHIHDYSYSYTWRTLYVHDAYCECGGYITDYHTVSGNRCIYCGGLANSVDPWSHDGVEEI